MFYVQKNNDVRGDIDMFFDDVCTKLPDREDKKAFLESFPIISTTYPTFLVYLFWYFIMDKSFELLIIYFIMLNLKIVYGCLFALSKYPKSQS